MFIKLTNGVPTPYTIGQLRKDNPNTSFPRNITPEELVVYSVYPYTIAEYPVFDAATQKVEEGSITQVNGLWVKGWNVVAKTAEELAAASAALQASIVEATQQRLDDFAKTRNYDGILSAATYATSTNTTFQAEGQRAVQLRDDTWQALYNILGQVATQGRVVTKFEDIEGDLPVLSWT